MNINKILENIEMKLFEIKSMFPVELGSGTDSKFSDTCSQFRANLFMLQNNLNEINKKFKKSNKKLN